MKKTHVSTLLATIFCVLAGTQISAQEVGKRSHIESADKPGDEISESPRETTLNTASLTAPDGKTLKLVLIGDRLPQLSVNGEKVDQHDLPVYEEYIEKLSGVIVDRQKAGWAQISAARERIKNQIIADLVEKKLVAGAKDVQSYYLTSSLLKINGKIQDPDAFSFFRNKYVKSADLVFYYAGGNTYQQPE